MWKLRNVEFKKRVRKGGGVEEMVKHKGYFHKWINVYSTTESNVPEVVTYGLVEDQQGFMHQIKPEDIQFLRRASIPDHDEEEIQQAKESEKEKELEDVSWKNNVSSFRSKMNSGSLPPSNFDEEEPPF